MSNPPTPGAPYLPPPWNKADVYAIKALCDGRANDEQQRRAVQWILVHACGVDDLSYRPGEDGRNTAMAEGRRFVGLQMRKLRDMPATLLEENEHGR